MDTKDTKQKVGPAIIIGAVLALGVLLFVLYRATLGPKGPNPADAAPEHRNMADFYRNQGRVGSGGGTAGGGGGAPGTAPR